MRSCSASGRACRVVPGQHRSKSRAMVMESTSATACSTTAPSPSQIRKPSASCSASGWRQSTFTTRSSPSRVTGATHAVCPPGWNGSPTRIDQSVCRSRIAAGNLASQPCRCARLAAAANSKGIANSSRWSLIAAQHAPNRPQSEISGRSVDPNRVGAPCCGGPEDRVPGMPGAVYVSRCPCVAPYGVLG